MCKEYCGFDNNVFDAVSTVTNPTTVSLNVVMKMIVGSVEKSDDGSVKVNQFVSFTTEDGHHILYPWDALKQTVMQWIKIEEGENES